jgi:translation initiation factor IF-2
MIDEVSDFVQGKLESLQEEILGIAKILASFPYEKTKVMGIKVSEGRIAKGDKIRLMRDDQVLGETRVSSARQGKEQTSKIESGQEGGIVVSPFLDFEVGDVLISHS